MEDLAKFMGYPVDYWLELQKQAKEMKTVGLIEEIAKLRGKLNFYESRIQQMEDMRNMEL
jgi:hypothetical protein